ncbi:hypothetical protein ACQ4PT_059506 [Festuca glaucescens]
MVLPSITDVTMDAVCPGRDECSVAIYLSGFQNAITGLGALVVTPIVGNLSDRYGRKALMTLPVTVAILPLFILACNRSEVYFYVYYVLKIVAGIFCEGSMHCLSLAYVADQVGTRRRAAAFGLLSGVSAAGFLSGTVTARFLPTSSTFQVAAAVAAAGAVYLRAFVPDSGAAVAFDDEACDPLLQGSPCSSATSSSTSSDGELSPRLPPYKGVLPSPSDMVALLTSSVVQVTLALCFEFSLRVILYDSRLLLRYYLKAQFGYSKDEFANLLLIAGAAGNALAGTNSIVPYFAAAFIILSSFVHPSIRTNVSKSVGSNEQGIAQGCISGISSFASILAPLVFTPLTAWFLSETKPFDFKGFSIMVAGFCTLIAFVISTRMRGERCGASEKGKLTPAISGSARNKLIQNYREWRKGVTAPPSLPLLLTGQSAFTTATLLALVLQPLRLMEATEEGPVSCARVARLLRPQSQGRRAERERRRLSHKLRRSHVRVVSEPSASSGGGGHRGCARKPCAWPASRAHVAAADVAEAAPASRACGQRAERKKRRRRSQRLRWRAEREQRQRLSQRLHQRAMRGGGQLQTVQRRLGRRGRLQR